MAWAEPMPGGGFRGRYRHGTTKETVLQPDGTAFPTKPKAKKAAVAAEVEAQRSAPVAKKAASKIPASITWGDWWDRLAGQRQFDNTDTTLTESGIVKVHLRPYWGNVPLNMIVQKKPVDDQVGVQEWVDSTAGIKPRPGMSAGYSRRIYGVFSVSIKAAVDEQILTASPCVGINLPRLPKRRHTYLTPPKIEKYDLRDDYHDMVTFGNETGFRPGEVCGLHASSCDLERGFVIASDVSVQGKKAIRHYPKDDDHRIVPLTDIAMDIVKRHLDGRDLTAGCPLPHLNGERCRSVLVFMSDRGKPVFPYHVSQHLRRRAKREKVEKLGMYASRHGFATRLADAGMNVFEIADLMGHSDLNITRGYVQESQQVKQRMLDALKEE